MNRVLMAVLAAAMALAPASARAGTPAAGVNEELRSGFFFDFNVGGFFVAGARNKPVSNAQVMIKLGLGYDFIKTSKPEDTFGFGVGVYYALGAAAGACFDEVDDNDNCTGTADFAANSFAAEAIFKVRLYDRLYLRPRLLVGYDYFPADNPDAKVAGGVGGVLAGAGLGLEYATHLDHFSIGIDVDGRIIIGPNIPAFAFYPMIKYTF